MGLVKIDRDEIFNRIAISPPYFAISHICQSGDRLIAKVTPEQNRFLETSPISSAEAGRHMSALGECSLAMSNKNTQKFYFLAKEARYKKLMHMEREGELTIEAKSNWLNPKSASALIKLFANEKELINLDIDYFPLPQSSFERIFKTQKRKTTKPNKPSPYADLPPFFEFIKKRDQLWANLGKVSDHFCQGHFDNWPVLPAAMLMGKLINLFEKHIQENIKNNLFKFYVEDAILSAQNIAFAGEYIKMVSNLKDFSQDKARLEGIVYNGQDKIICDLKANIRILK